jgi:hypothetical protein
MKSNESADAGRDAKTARSAVDDIVFFPGLLAGIPHLAPVHGRNLAIATWHFMISGRTFLEDAEGAVGCPEYMLMLKTGLAEVLFAADCLLRGAEAPDDLHRMGLFLELGLAEVADIPPDEARHLLALDRNRGDQDEYNAIEAFWLAAQRQFPAVLPDPLVAGTGQRDIINTLRAWSALFEQCKIDASFLSDLYKSL